MWHHYPNIFGNQSSSMGPIYGMKAWSSMGSVGPWDLWIQTLTKTCHKDGL